MASLEVLAQWRADDEGTMAAAYITCALWSSLDDDGAPMDDTYDDDDIAPESLRAMRSDCARFLADHRSALELMSLAQMGHDLWLTRNHHGAGFWDRGYPRAVSDELTRDAHAYGPADLYVGDDGHVYVA